MKKIGTYLKSFGQSIKSKPFVFILFILSVMLSVIVSAFFYRYIKIAVREFENVASYSIERYEDFDSIKFYNAIKDTSIKGVSHSYEKRDIAINEDGEEEHISTSYYKEYVPDENMFSREQLDSAEKIAIVGQHIAERDTIAINDSLDILGTQFRVIKISDNAGDIHIPSTVSEVVFKSTPENNGRDIGVSSTGNLKKSTMKMLNESGFHLKVDMPAVDFLTIVFIFVGVAFIAIASLNVFVASKFIADKNSKRYTLYKVVGAKNRDVAAMMVIESIFVLLIAFCLGAVVENFAIKPLVSLDALGKLNVVDYVVLFFVNATAVIITIATVIFKKLYSAPMSSRQRGL